MCLLRGHMTKTYDLTREWGGVLPDAVAAKIERLPYPRWTQEAQDIALRVGVSLPQTDVMLVPSEPVRYCTRCKRVV